MPFPCFPPLWLPFGYRKVSGFGGPLLVHVTGYPPFIADECRRRLSSHHGPGTCCSKPREMAEWSLADDRTIVQRRNARTVEIRGATGFAPPRYIGSFFASCRALEIRYWPRHPRPSMLADPEQSGGHYPATHDPRRTRKAAATRPVGSSCPSKGLSSRDPRTRHDHDLASREWHGSCIALPTAPPFAIPTAHPRRDYEDRDESAGIAEDGWT